MDFQYKKRSVWCISENPVEWEVHVVVYVGLHGGFIDRLPGVVW